MGSSQEKGALGYYKDMPYDNKEKSSFKNDSMLSSNFRNSSLNLSHSIPYTEAVLTEKRLQIQLPDRTDANSDDEHSSEDETRNYDDQNRPMLLNPQDELFYDDILNEEDHEKEEMLKFGTLDWLGVVFPFLRSENYHLYKRGRTIIENNADITIIMRKLQEFEMFKRLILDKEQVKLFQSLPKPNLTNLDTVVEEEEDDNYSDMGNYRASVYSPSDSNENKNREKTQTLMRISSISKENDGRSKIFQQDNSQFKNSIVSSKEKTENSSAGSRDGTKQESLQKVYEDLKKRDTNEKITQKLLKAFEDSVIRSQINPRRATFDENSKFQTSRRKNSTNEYGTKDFGLQNLKQQGKDKKDEDNYSN